MVDAQLTPSISRDDGTQRRDAPRDEGAPMPDAPAVHDIATQRRQIGADAVSGASVHSHPQTNANALPAACAVSNSATAKHVCNSRECVIRTAAETEVLLPCVQDPDQASTASPYGRRNHRLSVVRQRPVGQHQGPAWHDERPTPAAVQVCTARGSIPPPWRPNQHGRHWCSAAGSSWEGLLSMRRTSSGLKAGQLWYVRNVT